MFVRGSVLNNGHLRLTHTLCEDQPGENKLFQQFLSRTTVVSWNQMVENYRKETPDYVVGSDGIPRSSNLSWRGRDGQQIILSPAQVCGMCSHIRQSRA